MVGKKMISKINPKLTGEVVIDMGNGLAILKLDPPYNAVNNGMITIALSHWNEVTE